MVEIRLLLNNTEGQLKAATPRPAELGVKAGNLTMHVPNNRSVGRKESSLSSPGVCLSSVTGLEDISHLFTY